MPKLSIRKCAGYVIAEIPGGIEGENPGDQTGAHGLLFELDQHFSCGGRLEGDSNSQRLLEFRDRLRAVLHPS